MLGNESSTGRNSPGSPGNNERYGEWVKVVTVCDGEGDMYELFTKAQSINRYSSG
jgi:hypothetical protein